jgi:hypothetical protein
MGLNKRILYIRRKLCDMKKNHLFMAVFAFSLSMMSCTAPEDTEELDVKMKIDEQELEDEFEKLDNDVKKMDTTDTVVGM